MGEGKSLLNDPRIYVCINLNLLVVSVKQSILTLVFCIYYSFFVFIICFSIIQLIFFWEIQQLRVLQQQSLQLQVDQLQVNPIWIIIPQQGLLDGQLQFWTGEKFPSCLCGRAFLQAFFSIDDSEYCKYIHIFYKNCFKYCKV